MNNKVGSPDPLVVKNDELSGAGNLVFDYNVAAWVKQPEIAAAYEALAKTAGERIDDKQLSEFLSYNR